MLNFVPGLPPLPGGKPARPAINPRQKPIPNTKPKTAQMELRNPPTYSAAERNIAATSGDDKTRTGGRMASKGKRRRGRNQTETNAPGLGINVDVNFTSGNSESFKTEHNRQTFFDDRRDAPVRFHMDLSDTTNTMALEQITTQISNLEGKPISKLSINLCRYSKDLPYVGDNVYYRHMKTIFALLSRRVMQTVKSKLIDDFTFDNFFKYMQAVTKALEVYYHIDAILSYRSNTHDKNTGVIKLQEMLETSDVFTRQNELRRAIKAHWFPEEFAQLIRWTYQIYKTSDLRQAENYLFSPTDYIYFDGTGGQHPEISGSYAYLQDLSIDALTTGSDALVFSKIASVLSNVYPSGVIEGLPLSCSSAVYDPYHYEIFVNQPVLYTLPDSSTGVIPDMATQSDIVYAKNCDPGQQSGYPFVLQNLINTSNSDKNTNFLECIAVNKTSTLTNDTNDMTNKLEFAINAAGTEVVLTGRSKQWTSHSTADVHEVQIGASALEVAMSTPKSGFQRVYFDNNVAPEITLREFMDNLYPFRFDT